MAGPRRLTGSPAPSGGGPTLRAYRSPGDLATVVRLMLAGWLGLGVAALVGDLRLLLGRAEVVGSPFDAALALLGPGLGVAFVLWTSRVYRNLPALGADEPRFRPVWAVLGWFVPVVSLWRPKQLIDDAWRIGDPDLPPTMTPRWRGRPVSSLLHWWWGLFLVSTLLASATLLLADPAVVLVVGSAARVLRIVDAVLAALVVDRLGRRQDRRFAVLAGAAQDRRPLEGTPGRRWWAATVASAVVLGAAAASLSPSPVAVDGPPTFRRVYGITVPVPTGFAVAEEGPGDGGPTRDEGVIIAHRDGLLRAEGVAVYWLRGSVRWNLDGDDVALWMGRLSPSGADGFEPVGGGTLLLAGIPARYRTFTVDLGPFRAGGAYAVAGVEVPGCGRSFLLVAYEEGGGGVSGAVSRLVETAASLRCEPVGPSA